MVPDQTTFVAVTGDTYKYRHLFPRLHAEEQVVAGTDVIIPKLSGCFKAKFFGADDCSTFVADLRKTRDPMAETFKKFDGKVR